MENEDKVKDLIYTFGAIASLPEEKLNDYVKNLKDLSPNEIVKSIIVELYRLHKKGKISMEQIIENKDKIFSLGSDYHSIKDLLDELENMQNRNLLDSSVSLEENHRLVNETFDKFNDLIKNEELDCYYTGGLTAFFRTNTPLNRYHGDLDLMINEEDLFLLKKIIDKNPDFSLQSHMHEKNDTGHEFSIKYKDTIMSIGLFLFKREIDNSINYKSYYLENDNMKCKEVIKTPKCTDLEMDNTLKYHNGIPYKAMSTEAIYLVL